MGLAVEVQIARISPGTGGSLIAFPSSSNVSETRDTVERPTFLPHRSLETRSTFHAEQP